MRHLGIDLGGTKIEGIVLDQDHRELFRKRIPTEQEKGYTHILKQLRVLYESLLEKTEGRVDSLGIGLPGIISQRTGLLKNSNTQCIRGKLTRAELEKVFQRQVAIENDANCFAMAEAQLGAGEGKALVFGVIMGTGCGGGIIYQGKVLRGLQDIGGEWGHMVIDPHGPKCYCGSNGCVETFISGGGLERQYEKRFGRKLSFKTIMANYQEGKADVNPFVKSFFVHFGRALANLINVLDPDVVVLGGGVSNSKELYTEGVEEVRKAVFSDSLETPIVQNKLGDSAGVVGAALIGM